MLRGWAAVESWAGSGKLGAVREMMRRDGDPAPGAGHGDLPEEWSASLSHELALAGKTHMQVVRLAEQAALTVDPDLAERRRQEAQKGARVSLFREQAGTAGLSGRDLPPDEALAAMGNVNARAERYQDSGAFGDMRMDLLRVQAYLDLLNEVPAETRIAAAVPYDEAADSAELLAWAKSRPGRIGRPAGGPAGPPPASRRPDRPARHPARAGTNGKPPPAASTPRNPSATPHKPGHIWLMSFSRPRVHGVCFYCHPAAQHWHISMTRLSGGRRMKIRDKVLLGAAGAAVIAGTSTGVAQATASKPQAATTRVAPAAAAKAQAVTVFLNVKATAKVIKHGGSLKVSVRSSGCITDVIAWAYPAQAFGGASSAKSTKKGTSFTLSIPFSKSKPLGTWFLTDVNAVVCNTKAAGWNANWNGAYKFAVTK
jgi:hypothetical protein